MKSKQYPYEVYILRKRVNPSSESSQLISDGTVNQIRTGRQVLKNKAKKESTTLVQEKTVIHLFTLDIYVFCFGVMGVVDRW